MSVSAGVQPEKLLDAPACPQPSACSPAAGPSPGPLPETSSLDSCTSPHRKALASLCPHHAPPSPSPVDLNLPEEQLSNCPLEEAAAETLVLNDQLVSCEVTMEQEDLEEGDGQSQSQAKPAAVGTEPPMEEPQSHSQPSERRKELPGSPEQTSSHPAEEAEEVQEVRLWVDEEEDVRDQSEAEEEEEPVSPVPELDPALDDVVMELMTSVSPPATPHHLSSPSPPLLSRRGEGRALRPPPCSSRPSDDLSIRLRLSPFSTEASPETSPTRAPITPPPLSPPSPPLHSSTFQEFAPLSRVRANFISDFYALLFCSFSVMTVLLVSS